ncbi:uncharacterized protein LOC135503233 [Lineus longissimus]|uniref:uncharacterized protein LOC135503233 n=1 Tax=Lineus longissimus TaxID=88925 RepID=UPI00315CE93E
MASQVAAGQTGLMEYSAELAPGETRTIEDSPRRWVNVVWSLKHENIPYSDRPGPMSDTAIHRQKTLVMDEFMRLTKQEVNRLKPTASLEGSFLKRELTLVDDPWKCGNQAVRQLANVSRKGPHQRFFPGNSDPKLNGANNRFGLPLKPRPRKLSRIQEETIEKRKRSVLWAEKTVLPEIGQENSVGAIENAEITRDEIAESSHCGDEADSGIFIESEAVGVISTGSEAGGGTTVESEPCGVISVES